MEYCHHTTTRSQTNRISLSISGNVQCLLLAKGIGFCSNVNQSKLTKNETPFHWLSKYLLWGLCSVIGGVHFCSVLASVAYSIHCITCCAIRVLDESFNVHNTPLSSRALFTVTWLLGSSVQTACVWWGRTWHTDTWLETVRHIQRCLYCVQEPNRRWQILLDLTLFYSTVTVFWPLYLLDPEPLSK